MPRELLATQAPSDQGPDVVDGILYLGTRDEVKMCIRDRYKRMRDVREGFAQGNASAAITRERLEPLAQLIDASRTERVRLLFEHARSAQLDADTLVDDCAAAEALLDYLELCEHFICEPDADEMANLPVTLERSHGNQDEALRIVEPGSLGPVRANAIILCDLDVYKRQVSHRYRTCSATVFVGLRLVEKGRAGYRSHAPGRGPSHWRT